MSRDLLVREDLDVWGCENVECKRIDQHGPVSLVLVPRCHIRGASRVQYAKTSGILTITCNECGLIVASFQIAYGVPQ